MRKKNTVIMIASLMVITLFIGTAIAPLTSVAQTQHSGGRTLAGDPKTPNELPCHEAALLVIDYFVDEIKNIIKSINREDVKDMILYTLKYLPEFVKKVKVAFMTALERAKRALEVLYGFAINVAAMAQMFWSSIEPIVTNVLMPLALDALNAAYDVIIKEHGSIQNFLRFIAKQTLKLSTFLSWLAGEIVSAITPIALWYFVEVIIPGLGTIKDAICNFLINNSLSISTGDGATASDSNLCGGCAAASGVRSATA